MLKGEEVEEGLMMNAVIKVEMQLSENEKVFMLNSDFSQVLKIDNENSLGL